MLKLRQQVLVIDVQDLCCYMMNLQVAITYNMIWVSFEHVL
jgi:hypothetical protein